MKKKGNRMRLNFEICKLNNSYTILCIQLWLLLIGLYLFVFDRAVFSIRCNEFVYQFACLGHLIDSLMKQLLLMIYHE